MRKLLLVIFSITLLVTICSAQKPSKAEKKLLKQANKQFRKSNFKDAQTSYTDLIKLNPTNPHYQYQGGLSYYFSDVERTKSIPLFESAEINYKEEINPELKYYLGKAYHLNGDYKKSNKVLKEFIPYIKEHNFGQELMRKTEEQIQQNNFAIKYKVETDPNLRIKNLGPNINTNDREYAPMFKKDDNIILFTSRRKNSKGGLAHDQLPYEDIYVAKKLDEESWELITDKKELNKYLPSNFNSKKHDAGVIYTQDGTSLYTYKKDRLWKSNFKDGKWSNLKILEDNINNSLFNVPSISITPDGKSMFFVTTLKDGVGGKDIYKSNKVGEGTWSDPEILGPEINTEFDEDAPFLSEDGKTLYFSSKGHKGIGLYDIYKSEIVDGKPTQAVNMGIPFNSPGNDIYLVIEDNNKIGYLSSDRSGGFGTMDIYSFDYDCDNIENTEIRGLVYNETTKKVVKADLTLTDINELVVNETSSLASNGKYLMVAAPENNYKLTVNALGYEPQSVGINIPKQCEFYPLFSEIALKTFDRENKSYQVITMKNSFFDSKLAINEGLKNGEIDFSSVENQVPFVSLPTDKDFLHDKQLIALTRSFDVNTTSLSYFIVNDTIVIEKPDTTGLITSYDQYFGYNIKAVNTSNSEYIRMINNAAIRIKAAGSISIEIESSASRVPTKTFKTNILLASLRGDDAKEIVLKSLEEKGISRDKINITKINSIVSGPRYRGDYKNTKKYHKFQFVKIIIK